jgi:trigger factor
MEVTHKTNDNLTAEITVRFEENDYAEDVKKALNEYRRNANIRGFRPGKVPFGMIKNLYGEAVMADTISKKLGDALDKYLTEQKFNTLGQPLPDDEKQKPVNFKTDKEFSFHYVVGLKPDFDVEINDKIKLNYYDIEIADDAVDKYLMDIRKRFGKQTNPDKVSEGDVVFGTITELDADGNEKKDGISKDVSISVDYIKLKGVKNNFLKLKKGESVVFNPARAFKNDVELSSMLGIGLNEAKEFKSDMKFTLKDISHFEPAELNEELFAKVYEHDHIQNEEELRKRILRDIEETYKNEGKNQFMNDMVDYLIEKTNLELPDEFLKRWIIESNQKEEEDKRITPEELEAQYDNYRDTLRWQIIEEKISEKYGLRITNDEIKKRVGELLGLQVLGDDDEKSKEIIDQVTESVMQNRDEVNKIADQIMEQKLVDLFEEKAKITHKKIGYEDFVKMVTDKVAAKAEKNSKK